MPGTKSQRSGAEGAKRSDATRRRILEAAKVRFSREGYDGAGMRDLARDAGVDPALVVRYFRSKEGLFREIAGRAFDARDLIEGDVATLPERTARFLCSDADVEDWREGYDPFRLLLCSVGSAVAGPILAECFERDFARPLAAALPGADCAARAAVLAAYILGFALVRVPLASPAFGPGSRETIQRLLAGAMTACVEEG